MLEEGWKLISGKEVELIEPEVPPVLTEGFVRGELNEFHLLKRAFTQEFYLNQQTTSYFKLLLSYTNSNLARNKEGVSAKSAYRYSPVDEKTMWKFIGAYMIKQLQTNGGAEKVEWGGVDIFSTFLGKCRYKVSSICIVGHIVIHLI